MSARYDGIAGRYDEFATRNRAAPSAAPLRELLGAGDGVCLDLCCGTGIDGPLVSCATSYRGRVAVRRIKHNYDELYAGDTSPPGDIGKPQPALAALIDQIDIENPVLDVGCGTGDLAIHVTAKGHQVVGIDSSEAGVAQARSKAAEKGLDVAFRVADARRLEELDIRPRSVLDSGLLHSRDDEGQLATGGLRRSPRGAGRRDRYVVRTPRPRGYRSSAARSCRSG